MSDPILTEEEKQQQQQPANLGMSKNPVPAPAPADPAQNSPAQDAGPFSVEPPRAAEVARGAAEIADAGVREADAASKARDAAQDSLRSAGVAVVSAFEKYANGDGSPATQRAAIYAARVLGERLADAKGIEGGITSTIDFDRNGDFHLRFWRKSDGFPVQFDYNTMRAGLEKQGYLADLDKELRGGESASESKGPAGRDGKPLSAAEYFESLSKMDPVTRKAYSKAIGASGLFFGGDDAAMDQYFADLDAQSGPSVNPNDRFAANGRFWSEYEASKNGGNKARAQSVLRLFREFLDEDTVRDVEADLAEENWGAKPSAPAPQEDWHKTFQEKWNAAKDPESKRLVVDLFGQVLGTERVVAYKEQIEREQKGAEGVQSGGGSAPAAGGSTSAAGGGQGVDLSNPVAAEAASVPSGAGAGKAGESTAENSLGGGGESASSENPVDESNGAVARKGTYRENAKTQDYGFIAPRGTFFDADQLEWDSRKGRYVAKKDAKPWFPPAAGKTVSYFREEEPSKNGGKRFVHFTIDPRSVEVVETLKRAAIAPIVGGITEFFQKDKISEAAAMTAQEILARLGHHSTGVAHGGFPSYRMTKEDFAEFKKYVDSGKMPPKPKPAPASDDESAS